MILDCVILFVMGFVIDVFFAFYTMALQERKDISASNWAFLIGCCSMFSYGGTGAAGLELFARVISWASGTWVGTYATVKFKKKMEKNDK